jgi:hypothetical protein
MLHGDQNVALGQIVFAYAAHSSAGFPGSGVFFDDKRIEHAVLLPVVPPAKLRRQGATGFQNPNRVLGEFDGHCEQNTSGSARHDGAWPISILPVRFGTVLSA